MPKLTPREIKKGWWTEDKATVSCVLPRDGLLAVFDNTDEIRAILDEHYPHVERKGQRIWFFNETKDREIAEQDFDRISCNPQILIRHFLK